MDPFFLYLFLVSLYTLIVETIFAGRAMTTPFKTLSEAHAWFADGVAKYGQRRFTATEEYRAHYPTYCALYKSDKPARDALKAVRQESREGQPANLLGHALRGTRAERLT